MQGRRRRAGGRRRVRRAAAVALVGMAALGAAACGGGSDDGNEAVEAGYDDSTATNANADGTRVELTELNGSGVTARALVVKGDGTTTVSISTAGLQTGELHRQNIHRYPSDDREIACPTDADDMNGDGIVDVEEVQMVAGPIALELLPTPTTRDDGTAIYEGTFELEAARIYNGAIVINGAVVDGVFDPSVPVACGQLGV